MKIDIWHAVYTASMILLAFVAALVITKTVSKYSRKKTDIDESSE